MRAQHIPNAITIVRILLVYPVIRLMLEQRFGAALAVFVVAGISDAIDGFLAKHYGWQSRLGSYLDPLADKLLLVGCFITGAWVGLLPAWIAWAVVLRDVIIVTGAVAYYLLLRPFEGQPILASKLNTLLQLLLIVATLFHSGVSPLPQAVLDGLLFGTLATTVVSGGIYVYVWGRNYWRETRLAAH